MYSILIALHSLTRWLLFAGIILCIYRGFYGWLGKKPFSTFDNKLRHYTATISHIQLIFGLWLYFISPVITYFYENFSEAVHQRDVRFFGMEHSLMMLVAIVMITIGSSKAKRKTNDRSKFKTMAIWYTISLLIIISSMPWPFSPLTSRPYFRSF